MTIRRRPSRSCPPLTEWLLERLMSSNPDRVYAHEALAAAMQGRPARRGPAD